LFDSQLLPCRLPKHKQLDSEWLYNLDKQMCNDYEIPGFPTIIIEKDGNKINYNGLRTAKAIIETIQNL
jgi:hypothetical protein